MAVGQIKPSDHFYLTLCQINRAKKKQENAANLVHRPKNKRTNKHKQIKDIKNKTKQNKKGTLLAQCYQYFTQNLYKPRNSLHVQFIEPVSQVKRVFVCFVLFFVSVFFVCLFVYELYDFTNQLTKQDIHKPISINCFFHLSKRTVQSSVDSQYEQHTHALHAIAIYFKLLRMTKTHPHTPTNPTPPTKHTHTHIYTLVNHLLKQISVP